jgi:hypothetical protein
VTAGDLTGPAGNALHRRRELRPVGGGAALDAVVHNDVVFGDLGHLAEFERPADASLADRSGRDRAG